MMFFIICMLGACTAEELAGPESGVEDDFQQAAQRAVDDQRPASLSHLAGQLLRRP